MLTSSSESAWVVDLDGCDRWLAYQRLQELDIPCVCTSQKPLQVTIENAVSLVQLWSIVRRLEASRQDLSHWLNQCLIAS
jgi:hypothetical protein